MMQNLPPELILSSLRYLNFDDVNKVAWINRRMMQIVRRNLPMALEPKIVAKTIVIQPSDPEKFVRVLYFCKKKLFNPEENENIRIVKFTALSVLKIIKISLIKEKIRMNSISKLPGFYRRINVIRK